METKIYGIQFMNKEGNVFKKNIYFSNIKDTVKVISYLSKADKDFYTLYPTTKEKLEKEIQNYNSSIEKIRNGVYDPKIFSSFNEYLSYIETIKEKDKQEELIK